MNHLINNNKNKNNLYDARDVVANSNILNEYDLIGIDPGNDVMFSVSSESGIHFDINKNYYNHLSHITRNNIIRKNIDDAGNIKQIIDSLNKTNTKTNDLQEYVKYVRVLVDNWRILMDHHTNSLIYKLKYDTYINKEKALDRISKEIIENVKSSSKVKKKYAKNFDEKLHDLNKNKPLMIAFGNGNGRNTISNTKNSSSKGPIKKVMDRLSRKCVVISVPEHMTSQLCAICKNQLQEVSCLTLPTKRECKEDMCKDFNKKIVLKIRSEIRELKNQLNRIRKDNLSFYED